MVEKRFESAGQAASGVIMSEAPVRVNSSKSYKKAQSSAVLKYEILLVSWLSERPELTEYVFRYISPDDIETPVLKAIINELMQKKSIDEAGFLTKYQSDEESLKLAAEVFSENDKTGVLYDLSRSDLEKGLTEAVRAIKASVIEKALNDNNIDLAEAGRLLREKNELTKLRVVIDNNEAIQ